MPVTNSSSPTDAPLPQFKFSAKDLIAEGRTSQRDVDEMRSWLATQELPKLSDEQVVIFLLSCNNDHDGTKKTIEAYYKSRKNGPELFDNRDLDRADLQKQLNTL